MVEHFNDHVATAKAKELGAQEFLVYLHTSLDMPFITNLWFRFAVALVDITLRPPDLAAKGYTPDMVVPVYPNTSHPGGRAPVQSITSLPFDNCYHRLESVATVRLRRQADLFDEDNAMQVEVMQHVVMKRRFGEDVQRSVPLKTAQRAREPLLAHAAVCPLSQDSRLSASSDSHPPRGNLPSPSSNDSDVSEPDTGEADMEAQALLCKEGILGLAHDPTAERLPLVDPWFELTDHLAADTIPSPLEFYKEVDAIAKCALSYFLGSWYAQNHFVHSD
ncbi:hypothetical protein VTO73DRAFT_3350 [Trametes versicolor]